MENFINASATNKIKQPKPSVSESDSSKKYNMPYVGVIDTPKPTHTPITDTIVLKRKENPYTLYKIEPKKNSFFNFDNFLTLGVISSGIFALCSFVKNFKK